MIDLSGLPAVLKLAVSLGPFVVGFAGLAIHSHIAGTRHFEVMCEALQRSAGLHEELKKWRRADFEVSNDDRERNGGGYDLACIGYSSGMVGR